MFSVREYLAEIGRRGGIKSRRTLEPETARRMVAIREARRAAQRLDPSNALSRRAGTPADTTAAAQAVQDALQRRLSPAEKLAQVARLSRMVDQLSIEGLKRRHPAATDEMIRDLSAELRLGGDLAARVSAARLTFPAANALQDPIEVAADAGARLDALGVAWVIGGSIASSVHGEARSTQDVDMVVALLERHVTPFAKTMGREYYVDTDAMRLAVRSGASFNAVHFASSIKVDFFVAGDDPFEAERLRSRQRIEMPNAVLYVDTAEHTLLRKLEWYRRGGAVSERQWPDVQAIAGIQGESLHQEHLRLWAGRMGVTDLLERVMRDA